MCTAMMTQTLRKDVLFGRTMDFSFELDPELFFVPSGYSWSNILGTHTIKNTYSFMGIGQDISPVTFADGVNEMGFSAAVLYFPGFAQYDSISAKKASHPSIAAIELVKFLLGLCGSVEQVASVIESVNIVGIKDAVTNSVAPLHWIVADRTGSCMVIEKTAEGLQLMDNPIGVLSNSPDFRWQMTNLRNYLSLAPEQTEEAVWNGVRLTPFGQGSGTFGMPGDYTPPARFVRTAFQKSHLAPAKSRDKAVIDCFHVMESVSIPKGIVVTSRGTNDYTQYTAFIDITAPEYFFRTYQNSQITSVKLPSGSYGSTQIVSLGKLNKPISFARA